MSSSKQPATLFDLVAPLPETPVEANQVDRAANYRIPLTDDLVIGSARERVDHNIRCIQLLYRLEQEGQVATPEEKWALTRYAAFGGAAAALDPRDDKWSKPWEAIAKLLTPDDLESVRSSTPYAFFTPPTVVKAMWDALAYLGFAGGNVLEPAMGTGIFWGAMPLDLALNSALTGVEMDSVSGRVAKQLYPASNILLKRLQRANLPEASFDVVIGNVPFGQAPVNDSSLPAYLTDSIHTYFVAKSLRLVRPGGLVALLVSRYFLDSKDSQARARLAETSKLLAAIRLPNETFKKLAGTEALADLLIFQRTGETDDNPDWVETKLVELTDPLGEVHEVRLNGRLADYADYLMLGKPIITSSAYGPTFDLVWDDKKKPIYNSLPEALRYVLPAEPVYTGEPIAYQMPAQVDEGIQEGAYFFGSDGSLLQNQNGIEAMVKGAKTTIARIAGMVKVRDAARILLEKNLEGPDVDLKPFQQALMWEYQLFVARHGFLNNNANRSAFNDDPDAPFLRAMELYDEETAVGKPASIFFKRTINDAQPPDSVDTAQEALALSLNLYGHINWGYMEELTQRSFDELFDELEGDVYQVPDGRWLTASEYLSGNIREKLAEAEAAALKDAFYEMNVEALRQVLPDDVPAEAIVVNLGAGWIPPEYVSQFLTEMLDENSTVNNLDVPGHEYSYEPRDWERVKVSYIESMADWRVDGGRDYGVLSSATWGTKRAGAISLATHALNGSVPTIYDSYFDGQTERRILNHQETLAAREKLDKIEKAFSRWLWLDAGRAEYLSHIYNERFNSYVPRTYNGSHLTLPGLSVDMPELRPHQKNTAWRIMQGGNTLAWHIVGSGKTFMMIVASMEMRRLGLRSKIMHAVPNHLLEQYATAFYRAYPGAKLLLVNSKGLSKYRRAETLARIATGDWDAVIITHSAFGRIPLDDATFADFINRQIEVLDDFLWTLDKNDPDERLSIKEIQKHKERFLAKLEEREAKVRRHQDSLGLTWEQLGIDMLFVDEAHEFKNLWFPTKMNHLPGIGGSESGRAMDMFIKTQWLTRRCVCGRLFGLRQQCGCVRSKRVEGGSVIFATGTALANSVSELYTMQRYLQYDTLIELGISHFDAWAKQFGDTVTLLEMKPSGSGWRQNTRFAKFNNVPELLRIFDLVADTQADPEALGIKRPSVKGGRPIGIEAEPSDDFSAYMQDCSIRADDLPNVEPWEDNILKIMGDASKAALHMWLVDPDVDEDPGNKMLLCAREVYRIWRETTDVELPALPGEKVNLTQIVFLDTGTPKTGFNLYDYLKEKLIALGIPKREIAFIHDAKSDAARLKIFEAMNDGKLRVLIGSTTKMGTGANMQRLLKAQHDLDAPWRPADVEQRIGRTQRQGNLNAEVELYRYITSESLDFYKWHLLELKAKFIRQIMEGRISQRSIEDIDQVVIGFAEMKALATGDGLLIEKVEVESNLSRFYALRTQFNTERGRLKYELSQLPARISHLGQVVKGYERACAHLETVQGGEFGMKVNGRIYAERVKAGKALMGTAVTPLQPRDHLWHVGELWGFPIHTERTLSKRLAWLEIGERLQLEVELGDSPVGNVAKLMNALKGMPSILDNKRFQLEKLERQLPQYEEQVALPFEHAEQIDKLEARLREIEVTIENRYKEALAEETDEAKKSQAAYQAKVKQEQANGSTAVLTTETISPQMPAKAL